MAEAEARIDVDVTGGDRLKALRLRLKEVEKTFKLEFQAAIRAALEPLKDEVRQSALDRLPKRGGLAAKVAASTFSIRNKPSSVLFQTTNPYAIKRIDQGSVRHPVYGNRKAWVIEKVQPGFWSKPIEDSGPKVEAKVSTLIEETIRKIDR